MVTSRRGAKTVESQTVIGRPEAKSVLIISDDEEVAVDKALDLMDLDDKTDGKESFPTDWNDEDSIEDIDWGDEDDPQFCTEYVGMIIEYCREKEVLSFLKIQIF